MTDQHRFRMAVARHLGKTITPQIAAAIEVEAFCPPDAGIPVEQFTPCAYQGLVFAAERFRAVLAELHSLHEAHWAETERARHGLALAPNYEHMAAAERRGEMLQFTARQAGVLVGNIRMYIYADLHTGTRAAREDALFLLPQARHGFAAARFIDYVERCLAQIGCIEVTCDTKILFDEAGNVTRDVGVLLKRRGYKHVANRYHKRLSSN